MESLSDTEARMGMSGTRKDKSFQDPRICDIAGFFLSDHWPDRYTFDLSASVKIRNQQRIECQNQWRKTHGLPQLPLPQAKSTRVISSEASKITLIEWAENSATCDDAFKAKVSSLLNKPFSSAVFIQLLTTYATSVVPGTIGIEMSSVKDEDLTGVALTVRLIAGDPRQQGDDWGTCQSVVVGRRSIHGSFGSASRESVTDAKGWDDLSKAIGQAVSAAAETPYVVRVSLILNGKSD